jgi:dTDP-glucose 4,6-dehydratase
MKNILVTGGCGFIGSHFLNKTVKKYSYYNFINIDSLYYVSNQNNILKSIKQKRNYTFIQGNIQNQELIEYVITKHQIDTVIHLAGQTNLQGNLSSPIQYVKDNILGTQVLLEAVKKNSRIKKFIYVSSDTISGETEKNYAIPNSSLSLTQTSTEMLVKSYYTNYQLPLILIRACVIYGPKYNTNSWISKFINLLLEQKKCNIKGSLYQMHPFLYLDDAINGLECILLRGKVGEVYGMVSDFEYSELEITRRLVDIIIPSFFKKKKELQHYIDFETSSDNVNVPHYPTSSKKLQELGWKQEIFIQEGLEKTVNFYCKKHNSKKNFLTMEITDF